MVQSKKIYIYLVISVIVASLVFLVSFIAPGQKFFTTMFLPLGLLITLFANILALLKLQKSQQSPPSQVSDKNVSVQEQEKIQYEAILAYIGEGLVVIDKA